MVEQRLLSDPIDAERMIVSARHAERLLLSPRCAPCFEEIYLMPAAGAAEADERHRAVRSCRSSRATAVLSAPAPLRRAMIERTAVRARPACRRSGDDRPVTDDEILDATGASFRPSSTCAIGAESDPMAVVPIRIAACMLCKDSTSPTRLMPNIVSANTNIPTIMIAEHITSLCIDPTNHNAKSERICSFNFRNHAHL